jgi:hypothetical protein
MILAALSVCGISDATRVIGLLVPALIGTLGTKVEVLT